MGEGVLEVGDDVVRLLVERARAVAAGDVAVAARVLAAVELDGDAVGGPEAVDGVWAERFVSQRQLDAVLDEEQAEAALEVAGASPWPGVWP